MLDTVAVGPPIGRFRPMIAMGESAGPHKADTFAGVAVQQGDRIRLQWAKKPTTLFAAVNQAREAAVHAAEHDLPTILEEKET